MGTIKDYVRTALNGVTVYTKKLETKLRKEFDTKFNELDTKLSDKADVVDIVPQVQSDWNNIDEDSAAHILNRPFYDDIVHKTYTFYNVPTSGQASLTIGYIDGEFVEGESYVVTVNGTEYHFTATNETRISDGSRNVLLHAHDGEFRLHAHTWWSSGATVSISGPIHILKKLDGKFIDGVTSLNGEIGDVTIDRDKLSAAPIDYGQRWFYNPKGTDEVDAWFDWIGDGTEHGTGLICGDTHIFNKYDGDTPILCIFNSETTGAGQNYYRYDSILRGIESPKNDNDAASKKYVDTHIPTDDHINSLIDTKLDNFEVPDGGAATMQPLTFTGAVNATYDGSEAVSVEIPEGGGGGSAKAWRKISEFTLEEDCTSATWFSVNNDSDGSKLDLVETLLIIRAKTDGSNGNLYYQAFKQNNWNANYVIMKLVVRNNSKIAIHSEAIAGEGSPAYIRTTYAENTNAHATKATGIGMAASDVALAKITGANFQMPSGTLTGTSYEFWGVDR